jgi:hypothetical protein
MNWIKVNEALPENDFQGIAGIGYFLVTDGINIWITYRMQYSDGNIKWVNLDKQILSVSNITHWMSLPELPK